MHTLRPGLTKALGLRALPSQVHRTNSATARGEHALWVGNIPPNTTIMRLRDYFSDAMPSQYDLLSVSYNPDARYAFVNFRTESARMLAIQQAASQLVEGRRLDCRVRQNGSSRSRKVNYGLGSGESSPPISISPDQPSCLRQKVEELSHFPEAAGTQFGKEKYFIIKSYSLETLYQSLGSGSWQVPKRHVERLNHAFQAASKVYLVFSVNGSGHFFGYATMRAEISTEDVLGTHAREANVQDNVEPGPIDSDHDSASASTSRRQSLSSCGTTSSAGSISYEPERRKIIWHAPQAPGSSRERSTSDALSLPPITNTNPFESPSSDSLDSTLANFTMPCRIKWLSTQSIPFEEVRGLRNPWNSNKEVHIARNVTPVEPNAATALLRHWQKKEELLRSTR